MAAYFVAQININDFQEYQKYLDKYDDVFLKYKGEVLVVDDKPEILEGDWNYFRFVLIKFPSKKELKNWYLSPEYQNIAKYRYNSSKADIIVVHNGLEL